MESNPTIAEGKPRKAKQHQQDARTVHCEGGERFEPSKVIEGQWKARADGQWKVGGRSVTGRWQIGGRSVAGR